MLDTLKFNKALAATVGQVWQKDCPCCHERFVTTRQWEKRCSPCREADKPYTKRVFNPNESPF